MNQAERWNRGRAAGVVIGEVNKRVERSKYRCPLRRYGCKGRIQKNVLYADGRRTDGDDYACDTCGLQGQARNFISASEWKPTLQQIANYRNRHPQPSKVSMLVKILESLRKRKWARLGKQ